MIVDYITQREEEIKMNISKSNNPLESGRFLCNLCPFSASSQHKVFCHLEAKHFMDPTIVYKCEFCVRSFKTRNSYGVHISTKHRNHRGEEKSAAKFS